MNDDNFQHGQFQKGFDNPLSKKVLRLRQANEYQRLDRANEGVCYLCFKNDFVSATIVDVCYDCAYKRGFEPILKIVSKSYYGYCFAHGGYSAMRYENNIAQLNVRLCLKCTRLVGENHKELQLKGVHKADPFWKSMRRKLGKDFLYLGYDNGSLRK